MRTVVFIASLCFSIFVFPQSNSSDKSFATNIESTATAEEAWQLLTEVATWKQWDSYTVDAKLQGDFAKKAQGKLVTQNAAIVDFSIVAFDPGKMYTLRHKLSSGTLFIKRSVAPTDSGSKIDVEVWYKGLSDKNFQKYMGTDYAINLEKGLQAAKQLLEN